MQLIVSRLAFVSSFQYIISYHSDPRVMRYKPTVYIDCMIILQIYELELITFTKGKDW